MAASEIMRARQRNNLLVVEAHPIEDESDVICSLCAIGQPAPRWQLAVVDKICPAAFPFHLRPAHLFDRDHSSKCPEVRVCYPRELCLYGFEEGSGVLQAGIGRVATLCLVTHAGTVGAASVGQGTVRAGG